MPRASLREYAGIQRERYRRATRAEKHRLLDEGVAATGLHRKAASRLLCGRPRLGVGRGRPGGRGVYGGPVASAARVLWEATGQIGATRLQPFIPALVERLQASGELPLDPPTAGLLCHASVSPIERLLAPARQSAPPRRAGTTRRGTWLTHQIPLRTFAEWDDACPGFLEVDLVAHCGPSTEGFYLCTHSAVDVPTSWVELEAVWGKGQSRVGAAVHQVRQRLPMPLLGLDTDNGSEFINQALWGYCQREGITFTRSRAYKKHDGAYVKQKNGAIVRALIAPPPRPPLPSSSVSPAWSGSMPTSFNPSSGSCAKPVTAPPCTGSTTAPRPPPNGCAPRACCPRPRSRSVRRSLTGSPPWPFADRSTRNSNASGTWRHQVRIGPCRPTGGPRR